MSGPIGAFVRGAQGKIHWLILVIDDLDVEGRDRAGLNNAGHDLRWSGNALINPHPGVIGVRLVTGLDPKVTARRDVNGSTGAGQAAGFYAARIGPGNGDAKCHDAKVGGRKLDGEFRRSRRRQFSRVRGPIGNARQGD